MFSKEHLMKPDYEKFNGLLFYKGAKMYNNFYYSSVVLLNFKGNLVPLVFVEG